MILRLKRGIHIENPLLENIRDQYSELFSIVWYALVIVEQQYNVILNDDEISFILIHFKLPWIVNPKQAILSLFVNMECLQLNLSIQRFVSSFQPMIMWRYRHWRI